MITVQDIIDRYGSVRLMADALGVSKFTVYTWRVKGSIPADHDLRITARHGDIDLRALAELRAAARATA